MLVSIACEHHWLKSSRKRKHDLWDLRAYKCNLPPLRCRLHIASAPDAVPFVAAEGPLAFLRAPTEQPVIDLR